MTQQPIPTPSHDVQIDGRSNTQSEAEMDNSVVIPNTSDSDPNASTVHHESQELDAHGSDDASESRALLNAIIIGTSNCRNLPLQGDDQLCLNIELLSQGDLSIEDAHEKLEEVSKDFLEKCDAIVIHVGPCDFPSELIERWKKIIQIFLNCSIPSVAHVSKQIFCCLAFYLAVGKAKSRWTNKSKLSTNGSLICAKPNSKLITSTMLCTLQMSLVSSLHCLQAKMSLAFIWTMMVNWGWHPAFKMRWRESVSNERCRMGGLYRKSLITMARNLRFASLDVRGLKDEKKRNAIFTG